MKAKGTLLVSMDLLFVILASWRSVNSTGIMGLADPSLGFVSAIAVGKTSDAWYLVPTVCQMEKIHTYTETPFCRVRCSVGLDTVFPSMQIYDCVRIYGHDQLPGVTPFNTMRAYASSVIAI